LTAVSMVVSLTQLRALASAKPASRALDVKPLPLQPRQPQSQQHARKFFHVKTAEISMRLSAHAHAIPHSPERSVRRLFAATIQRCVTHFRLLNAHCHQSPITVQNCVVNANQQQQPQQFLRVQQQLHYRRQRRLRALVLPSHVLMVEISMRLNAHARAIQHSLARSVRPLFARTIQLCVTRYRHRNAHRKLLLTSARNCAVNAKLRQLPCQQPQPFQQQQQHQPQPSRKQRQLQNAIRTTFIPAL